MLAIIIPAHNEAQYIGDCLQSVALAAGHPSLEREVVVIIVVLDACTDQTAFIARSFGAEVLAINAANVGIARGSGARMALERGARWLAFTDADTVVPEDWLVAQLGTGVEAFCGVVEVCDWHHHHENVRRHFEATYSPVENHQHIHGANLGVAASAYIRAGGFPPLTHDEDVGLVRALEHGDCRIAWSAAAPVKTSARKAYKARGGFGETLVRVGHALADAMNECADSAPAVPGVRGC